MEKEIKYESIENQEETKKDNPNPEVKFKLNLSNMTVSEVKEDEE